MLAGLVEIGSSRFLSFFFFCALLEGVEKEAILFQKKPPTEWEAYFTGPLLAPSGTTIPRGHYDIQPFLFFTVDTGIYDADWKAQSQPNLYTINPNLFGQVGLTEWMDCTVIPSWSYNWSEGASDSGFNDLPFSVGFQLWPDDVNFWSPGIKLAIVGIVPLGKYQKLDPKKNLTDLLGTGAWRGGPRLTFYKLVHIKEDHFMSLNFNVIYLNYTKVSVEGLNAYGGGLGTQGNVNPGGLLIGGFSFEYSFSRHVAFAMDTVYQHKNKDRFSGIPGIPTGGVVAPVGIPSSEELSFAPALEYNFNPHLGIIGGVWFTALGRNAERFVSGAISVNVYY